MIYSFSDRLLLRATDIRAFRSVLPFVSSRNTNNRIHRRLLRLMRPILCSAISNSAFGFSILHSVFSSVVSVFVSRTRARVGVRIRVREGAQFAFPASVAQFCCNSVTVFEIRTHFLISIHDPFVIVSVSLFSRSSVFVRFTIYIRM